MQFYYLPSKNLIVFWSPKSACTSIVSWIKYSFFELASCHEKPRLFLQREGYNFTNPTNAYPIIDGGTVKNIVISYRDPASRILSAFVNKFFICGRKLITSENDLEKFSSNFAKKLLEWKRSSQPPDEESQYRIIDDFRDMSLQDFILFICNHAYLDHGIDSHFKPVIQNEANYLLLANLTNQAKLNIFPLRTQSFNADLSAINESLSLKQFSPPKVNATRPPSPDWAFSDDPTLFSASIKELEKERLIPTKQAITGLFSMNSNYKLLFEKRFRFDYQLGIFLDHLAAGKTG